MFCSLRERVLIDKKTLSSCHFPGLLLLLLLLTSTFNSCFPPLSFFFFLSPSPLWLFQPVRHQYYRFVCLSIHCTVRFDVISHILCPFFRFFSFYLISSFISYSNLLGTLLLITTFPLFNHMLPPLAVLSLNPSFKKTSLCHLINTTHVRTVLTALSCHLTWHHFIRSHFILFIFVSFLPSSLSFQSAVLSVLFIHAVCVDRHIQLLTYHRKFDAIN